MIRRLTVFLLSPLFAFYRFILSPALHLLMPQYGCRFYPTCSQYAETAIRTFPLHTAAYLIVKRVLRCHPFASSAS